MLLPDGARLAGACPKEGRRNRLAEATPKASPRCQAPVRSAHMADEPQSTDVLGSYTGTAQDGEHPVQDADDL